ncbi:YhgE/Pip family protein [Pseudogracilibacillus auburnensis]|uniref:Putative membrane protein n=1 Tax=Pseudogracilibacillus auburnensis TaxID=1494959 RepID=A0A2V3VUI6_9BACI|nr:YhgE/Pip domain-containing protein [Pseudogracilibacillus auburnensis]PXW85603.1 putative membrane protein [Pseudogracilibacillus auburnensis]
MKGILEEFSQIRKEHKLLIAIIAVIAVPILYAGMFLWAFWDPYDHLADLPIAVVNEDEGANQDGETMNLGDELVEKLTEDPEFDFNIVDKDTGYQGLQDQTYYILVEIPNDFSKNATTLMDDHPEKSNIIYIPNESYNFLASQIGETAMLQIETALQEKITETYAETIFDQIDEIADGLGKASDATTSLADGAEQLQDGSHQLSDHLATLAEKSIDFQHGVSSARSGVNELVDGSKNLANGMHQLHEGSNELLKGSKEIQSGSEDLASGVNMTNEGVQQLNEQIPSLVSGTDTVMNGLTDLHNQLPKELSTAIGEQLKANSEKMNTGLTELQNGITSGLTNELAPGISSTLSSAIADEMIATQKAQTETLAVTLRESGMEEQTVNAIIQQLQQNAPSKETLAASLQDKLTVQINGAIENTTNQINSGFDTYKTEVNKNVENATTTLEAGIKTAIDPPFTELKNGLSTINEGQNSLQDGVAQLADGTAQLQTGSQRLASGQNEYVDSLQLFTTKFTEANNGAESLATGTNSLFSGMLKLEDGSIQLSEGSVQLDDGSKELTEGVEKLVDGTNEFKTEMKDAAEEASEVKTNDETYNMMANPVEVKNEKINQVPNYGTGFAPYFLSLGLFVGALLLSIVYPLKEPASIPKNGLHWFFSKFSVLFVVGILQAVIASGFLLLVLKLEVQSVPLFMLFAIITSLVFITLVQFLVTCFDDPGRFIAIIILIMQLTTSAGTFPLELIPKILQPINYILPMTYSVAGFKAVISSGEFHVMWQNAGVLMLFTLFFLLLTVSYFIVMFKRKYRTVQEA